MKMLNKITLSCLCASTLLAQTATIQIKPGWNMYGYDTSIDIYKTFSTNENIEILWKYNGLQKKWMACSPKYEIQEAIKSSTYVDNNLSIINPNEGFWIYANYEETIPLDGVTDYNTTEDNNISYNLGVTVGQNNVINDPDTYGLVTLNEHNKAISDANTSGYNLGITYGKEYIQNNLEEFGLTTLETLNAVSKDANTTLKYVEFLTALGVDTNNIDDVNITQVIEKLQYSYGLNWETPPPTPE